MESINMDGILMTLMGLLSVNLIIPLTDWIKKRWLPPGLAFLTWTIQLVMTVLFTCVIGFLVMPGMAGATMIALALVIMGGNGASHANAKMKVKMNGGQ